jgi:hypothetical protein
VSKLHLIDTDIRELRQLRKELAQMVAACDANVGESHCAMIERLTTKPRDRLATAFEAANYRPAALRA